MNATITLTARQMAEISEKSPGIVWIDSETNQEITEVKFRRRENGRRDRFIVEMLLDGERGVFDSDVKFGIKD